MFRFCAVVATSLLFSFVSASLTGCAPSRQPSEKSASQQPTGEQSASRNPDQKEAHLIRKRLSSGYETLDGWLSVGVDQKTVLERLGAPQKGEDQLWEALGSYVQKWSYPEQGVVLQMESPRQGGEKKVLSLSVESPSSLKTSRGAGVGASEDSVRKLYSAMIDDTVSKEGRSIVVGSIYAGTIFTVENRKVIKIFIGGAAY